jgi:hypothetical protein
VQVQAHALPLVRGSLRNQTPEAPVYFLTLVERTVLRPFLCTLLAALALSFAGCSTLSNRPPPPTLDELVQMSRDGVPADEIIRRLEQSHAVYRLSGSQLAKLHEQGLPEPVLDYLQQSYIDSVRWQERMYYQDRMWMGGCVGCYYYRPWPSPFYFPY